MMKTGIEEGSFAFPKSVPFTRLIFFRCGNFAKASFHITEARMGLHFPSFFMKCRGFLAPTIQQMN